MIIVSKVKVNVYTPTSIADTADFKNKLIDDLVIARDKIRDKYNQDPTLTCSVITDYFLEWLFKPEGIYKKKNDKTTLWAMPLDPIAPATGYIYFNIKEKNNDK